MSHHDSQPPAGSIWSLESLTKAYQQGYMAGLTGQSISKQPFDTEADVVAAAWEAGWSDGSEQLDELNRRMA